MTATGVYPRVPTRCTRRPLGKDPRLGHRRQGELRVASLRSTAAVGPLAGRVETPRFRRVRYRRTDVLDKRRQLIEPWMQWCEPKAGGNVIAFGRH